MDIILVEDVPNLGSMGELVSVKPGYGRNFLIPRGLAVLATAGSKRELAHRMRQIETRKQKLRGDAETAAAELNDVSLTIAHKAGEDGRLFGSVTNRDVEAALIERGITVDRRRIVLNSPIKALGIYEVPIKLHADVEVSVKVWVCAV